MLGLNHWIFVSLRSIAFVVFGVVLGGCGRSSDVHWRDGNFVVYATDLDFNETRLGYDHKPGILGLVEGEVVAAGSNAQVVFVKRKVPGGFLYYVVEKGEAGESFHGVAKGPYGEREFEEMRKQRGLPDFSWRKK